MHCTLKYLNQKTACISINFSSFLRWKGPNIVTELTLQLESSCNRGICLHKMAYSKLKTSNQNRAEVDLFSVLILVKFIRSWYLVSRKTDSLNFNCMVKISVVQWNQWVGCQINANSCFSSEYSRKRCICTVQWWKLYYYGQFVCVCMFVCLYVCVCLWWLVISQEGKLQQFFCFWDAP